MNKQTSPKTKREKQLFRVELAKVILTGGIIGSVERNWEMANQDARTMAMSQAACVIHFLKESEIL